MPTKHGNRPLEIFGFPAWNQSQTAQNARRKYWCPFQQGICDKKSRLIDYPFGVCSTEHSGGFRTICPTRFEEQGSIEDVPKVLEDIALHYFGDFDNTIAFPEIGLRRVGSIDFVLVRHKPMKAEVEDFVSVEIQSDSTTSTGKLVDGLEDFIKGCDIQEKSYGFGMNTYDSIKRAITQLMNKGIVYESWNTKCYWVIQEYIYSNLVSRYGFKASGFSSTDASRFAIYDLVQSGDTLTLECRNVISTTVDEIYQAMKNRPRLPKKDDFVRDLNLKLRLKLDLQSS